MSNYKVKVNNNVESREVQELFEQLGLLSKDWSSIDFPKLISNHMTGEYSDYPMNDSIINRYKELTIPQLKDLVVLKRNDKNDRNVIDPEYDANLYLDSDNKLFVFHLPTQTWKESNLNGENEVMQRLKPISPLKEYLVPQGNGKYALTKATEKRVSDWVEVPSGANYAYNNDQGLCFLKGSLGDNHPLLVWTRHTQPEDLPFVDDEPKSLSDVPFDPKPKSLNTTYAEIEQVRQTLNERQSTYGGFTSVANTTGQLMAVILNSKNGQTLPYAHEEALHMICSKIARIMNGDINHKDSWHDIAGYATLIDESL